MTYDSLLLWCFLVHQLVKDLSPFLGGWLEQLFRKHDELPQVIAKLKVQELGKQESDLERHHRLIYEASERDPMMSRCVEPSLFTPTRDTAMRMTEANIKTMQRNRIDMSYDDGRMSNRNQGRFTLSFPIESAVCHWLTASGHARDHDNFRFPTVFLAAHERDTYDHTCRVALEFSALTKVTVYAGGGFVAPKLDDIDNEEFEVLIGYTRFTVPFKLTEATDVINETGAQDDEAKEEKKTSGAGTKRKKGGRATSVVTAAKRAKTAAAAAKRKLNQPSSIWNSQEAKECPYDIDETRLLYDPKWKEWDNIEPDQIDPARRVLVEKFIDLRGGGFFKNRELSWIPYKVIGESSDVEKRKRAIDVLCRRGKHTITAAVFHGLVTHARFHPMFIVVADLAFARLDEEAARWKVRRDNTGEASAKRMNSAAAASASVAQ